MPDTDQIIPLTRAQWDAYYTDLNNERNHVKIAHGKILTLRQELRLLNAAIVRRKRGIRRLRAYVDAVKRLHAPFYVYGDRYTICRECCCDGNDVVGFVQSERCETYHDRNETCWPCHTINAINTIEAVKG